jgi:hypothetical protein
MGGQTPGMLSWVSFLLFPHLLVCCGGVAGWNITPEIVNGFGTLLGPEKTSCRLVGCFFWWPLPARDRLTHPCGGRLRGVCVGVVVVVWGSGCGGVLSVA